MAANCQLGSVDAEVADARTKGRTGGRKLHHGGRCTSLKSGNGEVLVVYQDWLRRHVFLVHKFAVMYKMSEAELLARIIRRRMWR